MIAVGIALTLLGWIAMMVSFWLPHPIGQALMSTALSVGIPGLVFAIVPFIFAQEIEEYHWLAKPTPLRCTDCGSKILNAGGTTVGDQIEGELMIGPWDNER